MCLNTFFLTSQTISVRVERKLEVELRCDDVTLTQTGFSKKKKKAKAGISHFFFVEDLGFWCRFISPSLGILHVNLSILLSDNPSVFGYMFLSLWKI